MPTFTALVGMVPSILTFAPLHRSNGNLTPEDRTYLSPRSAIPKPANGI